MKRILIRSGKSPFRVATPAEFVHQNLIGTNTGNLLFSDAAHRLLMTRDTEVMSNGISTDYSAERAAEINEQYDAFVVPLANAFRPAFRASLDRLSNLIEQLTIPVVVFGVGAQVGDDYATDCLSPMEESVKRFASAVLDRSASIGVRGELTASYLNSLGFHDIDIIGCPSMFLYGDRIPDIRPVELGAASRIAINLSPNAIPVGDLAGIARHTWERYRQLTYYAQNTTDAELLLWGDTTPESGFADPFPRHRSHPLLRDNKVRVPLDPTTWIRELAGYDFAFGTRIHGNIAALLAGTPSVVLTHDSRTLELCRYFDIPYRPLATAPGDTDPRDLYEQADFSAMLNGHGERFERIIAFLDRNNLQNTYTHGDKGAAYDAEIASLELPASMQVWDGGNDAHMRYRVARLRELITASDVKAAKDNNKLRVRLAAAEKRQADSTGQLALLREELAITRTQIAALERRITRFEKQILVRIGPALRRRIRRLTGRADSTKST
jgi:hypothetical protein